MPAYRTRDASARSKSSSSRLRAPSAAAYSSCASFTDAFASASGTAVSSSHLNAARSRSSSSALEVSTDAPLPPSVTIISPTPRAFTFPINDTRFPISPSSSPFEPTLKSIPSTPPPLRPFSPTSSIGSDSSISVLSSPTAPPSSQASSHRRRRSTASDIGERRPKKGDDDYIKRPENAFILFRRKKCEERQAAQEEDDGSSGPVKKQRQADLSKTISQQWKGLSAEDRQYWEDLAKEKKKEHEAMYPNYVYRPQRSKDKKSKKGKTRHGEQDAEAESFSFLLPVSSSPTSRSFSRDFTSGSSHAHAHGHGHGRRAASAPTPPPAFQTIQLPSVWMPSCPTSPTLIPRISGRSPAPVANIPPPTESAPLTTFDYAPNDNLFMPSYQAPSAFDGSSLQQHQQHQHQQQQPNDVYQNMFQMADNAGMAGGAPTLLHALSIPPRDASIMSPAEAIASSLVSPTESYMSSMSPTSTSVSSHGGPFTPADALHMMSLVQQKDVPENVDTEHDASEVQMPFGFWPGETLWANIDGLMPDFNLGSIPPVELGLAQFEAMTASIQQEQQQQSSSSSSLLSGNPGEICGEWLPAFDEPPPPPCGDFAESGMAREEHDYHDDAAATPGGPDTFSEMFGHEHMNW